MGPDESGFEVYDIHKQNIIGHVKTFYNSNKFNFGTIYGMHTIQDRKVLWDDMKRIIDGITRPYILIGDYNTILTSDDRTHGNPVQEFEVKYFKDFIWEVRLTELRTAGRKYTWTNNQIHSKIDWMLANTDWIQKWTIIEGTVLNLGFSDHCRLSITIKADQQMGTRPFKFFNCLTQHKNFENTVKKIWAKRGGGTAMYKVWKKLKMLKIKLKQPNSQNFNSTGQRIQTTRAKLEGI